MKQIFQKYGICFLLLFLKIDHSFPYTQEYLKQVTDSWLASYKHDAVQTTTVQESKKGVFGSIKKWLSSGKKKNKEINPYLNGEMQRIISSFCPLQIISSEDAVVDFKIIENERIINGTQSSLLFLLKPFLKTVCGERFLVEQLTQPITDRNILIKRQNLIKGFLHNDNKELLNKITEYLELIKVYEKSFLALHKEETPFQKEALKSLTFGKWFGLGDYLNKSSIALEARRKIFQLVPLWSTYLEVKASTLMEENLAPIPPFVKGMQITGAVSRAYGTYIDVTSSNKLILIMKKRLYAIASLIEALKDIYDNVSPKNFLNSFTFLQHIKGMTDPSTQMYSKDFYQLIKQLNTASFRGESLFYLSLTGNIIKTQKLIGEVKGEFDGLVKALGEIDLAVALTHLYKEYAKKETTYCFAQYSNKGRPLINIKDFWNPFIKNTTITNSVALGGKNPSTMILTGPNTGGKSTLIEGILLTNFFAQTLGIVPASECSCSIFDTITLYARIGDNITEGQSRFKAEAAASEQQLKAAQQAQEKGKFSLNVRDEGIVGTDRRVGEAAEFSIAEQLGGTSNTINLISTHYSALINLEKKNRDIFKNYYMEVTKDDKGIITRHFKIKDGINKVSITKEILQEHGFKSIPNLTKP